jgi:hypothetical protein
MTPAQVSRIVCVVASVATVAMMLIALGPFDRERETGEVLMSLLLLPFLAIWAVGPYMVANRFAADVEGAPAWVFVAVQVVTGAAVMAIYTDVFIFDPKPDAQSGLVFAIFPVYQFIAVLGAHFGVRVLQRWR